MFDATECQEVSPFTEGMIVDSPYEPNTTKSEKVPPLTQGMMVDFPCEPRVVLRHVCAVTMFERPQVQISRFSQLFFIPYDDAASKWYTQEEEHNFKQARLSDIRTLRDLLRDATPALISEEILCECVGMENILSSCTALLVIQKKRAHSEAILSVQRNYKGDHMIEMLATTSQKSSRWARKRAANMALGFVRSVRY